MRAINATRSVYLYLWVCILVWFSKLRPLKLSLYYLTDITNEQAGVKAGVKAGKLALIGELTALNLYGGLLTSGLYDIARPECQHMEQVCRKSQQSSVHRCLSSAHVQAAPDITSQTSHVWDLKVSPMFPDVHPSVYFQHHCPAKCGHPATFCLLPHHLACKV